MRKYLLYITGALLLTACNQELEDCEAGCELTSLNVSVEPYIGESDTRANFEGTGFADGDWIRLKMICPYAEERQVGEYTHSGSSDGFWLLKYNGGSSLTNLTTADGCDIDGDFKVSNSSNVTGLYLSQQTPYVFVAQTWNEEKAFYYSGTRYLQYSYTFQADQSKADGSAYKKNDLLWAQQFMQTGTPNVHLTFNHKMAALKITIDDSELIEKGEEGISANAVLTLEGMPDIDQMEVAIGDYYAAKDESNTAFGYKQQTSCSKENNGNVLGVVVLDFTSKKAVTTPIASIQQTGTYKAYNSGSKVYRLIVPPCTVTNPVFYMRDGNRRFKVELSQKTFEQGTMYNLTLKLGLTNSNPDPVTP